MIYELIGKAVVAFLAMLVPLFAVGLCGLAVWFCYHRVLTYLINLCWRGYDIHGEHPPRWQRELAIYLHAIKHRDFETIQTKREQLKKREERDTS